MVDSYSFGLCDVLRCHRGHRLAEPHSTLLWPLSLPKTLRCNSKRVAAGTADLPKRLRAGCVIVLNVRRHGGVVVTGWPHSNETGGETAPSLRRCRQEGGNRCHTPPLQGRPAPPSLSSSPTSRAASQCKFFLSKPRLPGRDRQRPWAGSLILHKLPLSIAEARTNCCAQ